MRSVTPLLLLVLPLAACGDSPSTERSPAVVVGPSSTPAALVADVAHGFMEAVRIGDDYARDECLTHAARVTFDGEGALELSAEDLEGFSLGAARVTGAEAEVPVTATVKGREETMALLLRQEEQAWRVMGMRVYLDPTTSLTMDFENPDSAFEAIGETLVEELGQAFEEAFSGFSDYQPGASAEEIDFEHRRFVEVQAVSPERHAASWQVRLSGEGRPAFELMEELLADTCLVLDREAWSGALSTPVSLELDGVSRLEAFEALARACGLHPIYPDPAGGAAAFLMGSAYEPPTVSFERGERPLPAAFVGPFLVEVQDLVEEPPHGTGRLTLTVRALGMSPAVTSFQRTNEQTLEVGAVVTAGGINLNADDGITYFGLPQVDDGYVVDRQEIPLKGLLSSVDEIGRVTGTLRVSLPETLEEVRVDPTQTGPVEQGGFVVSPTSWGESVEIKIESSGASDLRVMALPYDVEGQPMGTNFAYGSDFGDHRVHSVQAYGTPASLGLKIGRARTQELSFVLEGVPLERAPEQPGRIESLRFDGEAPLGLTFGGFESRGDMAEIRVELESRANKEIRSARVKFVYLDDAGTEVGAFPHTLTGEFSFEGQASLLAVDERLTKTLTAFFLPEEAARVDFVVEEITFRDATVWNVE